MGSEEPAAGAGQMVAEPHNADWHCRPTLVGYRAERFEDDALVEAIASSLVDLASMMAQVSDQLTNVTETVGRTKALRSSEAELGALLVHAQSVVDQMIGSAQEAGRQIVIDAQRQASRVVIDAQRRAAAIVDEAEPGTFLRPNVVDQLTATLAGLTAMNHHMVQGITLLRESLVQWAEPVSTPSAAAPGPFTTDDSADLVINVVPEPSPVDPATLGADAFARSLNPSIHEASGSAAMPLPAAPSEAAMACATTPSSVSYRDRKRAKRDPVPRSVPRRAKHLRRRRKRLSTTPRHEL